MSATESLALPSNGVCEREEHTFALAEEVMHLFDQFRSPLLAYLLTFGLSLADCEEIVQETFLALFQHLGRGGGRQSLRGWLYRVSHNLALKRRHMNRRESPENTAVEWMAAPGPNPEESACQGQTQDRILATVQALPENHRRCLTLRAEGLRYREIAAILDISLGSVTLYLTRSLARIARVAER